MQLMEFLEISLVVLKSVFWEGETSNKLVNKQQLVLLEFMWLSMIMHQLTW